MPEKYAEALVIPQCTYRDFPLKRYIIRQLHCSFNFAFHCFRFCVFYKRCEEKAMGNEAVRNAIEMEAAIEYIMELVLYQHRRTLKTAVMSGKKSI